MSSNSKGAKSLLPGIPRTFYDRRKAVALKAVSEEELKLIRTYTTTSEGQSLGYHTRALFRILASLESRTLTPSVRSWRDLVRTRLRLT